MGALLNSSLLHMGKEWVSFREMLVLYLMPSFVKQAGVLGFKPFGTSQVSGLSFWVSEHVIGHCVVAISECERTRHTSCSVTQN